MVDFLGHAGLEDYAEVFMHFGFASVEDLLNPDLVRNEDLTSYCGMGAGEVERFRAAVEAVNALGPEEGYPEEGEEGYPEEGEEGYPEEGREDYLEEGEGGYPEEGCPEGEEDPAGGDPEGFYERYEEDDDEGEAASGGGGDDAMRAELAALEAEGLGYYVEGEEEDVFEAEGSEDEGENE